MLKVTGNLVLAIPYAESSLKPLKKKHLHKIIHTQATQKK